MHYAIAVLYLAFYFHKILFAGRHPVFLQDVRHDHYVRKPSLIQQGHKHESFGGAGPLARVNLSGSNGKRAIAHVGKINCPFDSHAGPFTSTMRHGMNTNSKPSGLIVSTHAP